VIGLTDPARARELSEKLVQRFGSFGGTLAARPTDRIALLQDAEEVERTFRCLQNAVDRLLRAPLADRSVISDEAALLDYLRGKMAFQPVEQLRVLFLNAANELMADEIMAVGTVSAVHAYPREILKRCLELGATALLLAHNHPSGNPAPSSADREMTGRIVEAARSLGVKVHDHLVVARSGCISFRKAGYL